MCMLLERPVLWRLIAGAVAGVVAGAAVVTTCAPEHDARSSASPDMTSVHIKLRPGAMRMASIEGATPTLLFSSTRTNRAAFDDPRVRWVRIDVPRHTVDAALARLATDPAIEQAFVPPTITLPAERAEVERAEVERAEVERAEVERAEVERAEVERAEVEIDAHRVADTEASCPIKTPSFESYQGYLGPAPEGIDATAAWRRGALGQGVWFADIEGGWNAAHEDLPGDRITHVAGDKMIDRYWQMHGTAVLGEVVGLPNGKGVVGIAPEVERVFTSSIGGITVADAIDAAAEQLRAGDVLLIELQGSGPRGRYLPVEFWDDNYDAIEAATRRGVIVIEAAGNGAENLDHKAYGGKLERTTRDSGAIMIGAGGPPRDGFADRERLDFSNYGSRVDVQGWGRMVATLDYGDLQACAGADRHYTNQFAGTSSASPIVAGAAILVQSVAKSRGRLLGPAEMRALLRATGTPQAGTTREAIGPRPDLARALDALERQSP